MNKINQHIDERSHKHCDALSKGQVHFKNNSHEVSLVFRKLLDTNCLLCVSNDLWKRSKMQAFYILNTNPAVQTKR